MTGTSQKRGSPGRQLTSSSPVANSWLRDLQQRVSQALLGGYRSTAAAEAIIDEMARRQGLRLGPYFDWSAATAEFRSRFRQAYAAKPREQTIEDFAWEFVEDWPPGPAALRLPPEGSGKIGEPPYSRDGLWPAFLNPAMPDQT